jgi:hypothetical protein
MFDDEPFDPTPLTAGDLGKPPRWPPTAIGLLTPPPPSREPRAKGYFTISRTRMVAVALLGGLFVAGGPAAVALSESIAGLIVGSSSVLIGGSLWYRLARALRNMQVVDGEVRYVGPKHRRRAA